MPRMLRGVIYRDGQAYTAECFELGIATCGETVDEARAHMEEAIDLYSRSVEEATANGKQVVKNRVPFYHLRLLQWYYCVVHAWLSTAGGTRAGRPGATPNFDSASAKVGALEAGWGQVDAQTLAPRAGVGGGLASSWSLGGTR